MAEQITNYQCPACGGPLHFVGASGKLECDYCGSTYEVAEIEKLYQEKDKQADAAFQKEEAKREASAEGESWDAAAEGMHAYNCPSCGAELISTRRPPQRAAPIAETPASSLVSSAEC